MVHEIRNFRDFLEFDGTRTVHLIFLAGENPKSISLLIDLTEIVHGSRNS